MTTDDSADTHMCRESPKLNSEQFYGTLLELRNAFTDSEIELASLLLASQWRMLPSQCLYNSVQCMCSGGLPQLFDGCCRAGLQVNAPTDDPGRRGARLGSGLFSVGAPLPAHNTSITALFLPLCR